MDTSHHFGIILSINETAVPFGYILMELNITSVCGYGAQGKI